MGTTVLSFNKRVSLCKKEVFEGVTNSNELSNIKGTTTTGYYSIATIEKFLFPACDKYDLDLDITISKEMVMGEWIDCVEGSDKTRCVPIDFSRIEVCEKLALMANVVMSDGAIKSYTRRYALTAILRLPSTDLIDSDILPEPKPPQQNAGYTPKKTTTSNPPPADSKVELEQRSKINNILWIVCEKKKGDMSVVLSKITSFIGKDGKEIKGVTDAQNLKGKRLEIALKNIMKDFPDATKTVEEAMSKKFEPKNMIDTADYGDMSE